VPPALTEVDSTGARIMAAALRLFGTKGYGAVGIREIALEAGISTAALYHYMRTKEDLLVALMVDRLRRVIVAGRAATAGLEAPEKQLVGLVRVHIVSHGRYPETVIDQEVRSLSPQTRPGVVALRDEYEDLWRTVLDEGVAPSQQADNGQADLVVLADQDAVDVGDQRLAQGAGTGEALAIRLRRFPRAAPGVSRLSSCHDWPCVAGLGSAVR
jgi:AcrR family transcriptional regulator